MRGYRLRWGLAVAVLVVWTMVGYRVVTMVWRDESDGPSADLRPATIRVEERFSFKQDIRDPFHYLPVPAMADRKAGISQAARWSPPPLKLAGVMRNRRIRTAIIEAGDGRMFFIQEGDTVQGVKVVGIGPDSVTYRYRGVHGRWTMEIE